MHGRYTEGRKAEVVVPPCSKVDTATPIIYNTKTVKLIDSGVHRFTFGGGMNCVGFSAPYRLFTTMGAIDTWSLCESTEDKGSCSDSYPAFDQKTRLVCREYNPVAGGTYMTGAIDHIFYIQRGEKPSFRKFDIIHENYLCTASDHCPVVLDMDF